MGDVSGGGEGVILMRRMGVGGGFVRRVWMSQVIDKDLKPSNGM